MFTNTKPDVRIVQEEIFGPVLVIESFNDEADLREISYIANNIQCTVSQTAIWTCDLSRAHGLSAEIKVGMVWVNTPVAFNAKLPFGGHKQSGWGCINSHRGVGRVHERKIDHSGIMIGSFENVANKPVAQ